MDQMLEEYRTCRAILRWHSQIFFDLIAICALASWVLYQMKFTELPLVKKKDRRIFLYKLGKSIVSPPIQLLESSHYFKHLENIYKVVSELLRII